MIFLIFHGPLCMIGFILGVLSNFARPYFPARFLWFSLDEWRRATAPHLCSQNKIYFIIIIALIPRGFFLQRCFFSPIYVSAMVEAGFKSGVWREDILRNPRDSIVQMIDRSFLSNLFIFGTQSTNSQLIRPRRQFYSARKPKRTKTWKSSRPFGVTDGKTLTYRRVITKTQYCRVNTDFNWSVFPVKATVTSIFSVRHYYSCAVWRMSCKMGFVSSFWCYICACKFMLAYIYHHLCFCPPYWILQEGAVFSQKIVPFPQFDTMWKYLSVLSSL